MNAHYITIFLQLFIFAICYQYNGQYPLIFRSNAFLSLSILFLNIIYLYFAKDFADAHYEIECESFNREKWIDNAVDKVFRDFDKDNSDDIDWNEAQDVIKFIKRGREDIEKANFFALFKYTDKNNNGVLDRDECKAFMWALY